MQIKADVTIGANSDLSASEEFKKLQDDIKGLQNQIDGKVEAFYFDYDPSIDTYPTNEWTTDTIKEEHLNDTFTNTESCQSWRWLLKDGVYQWVAISDTQALQMAQDALNLANSKVTIFTEIPTPPYKVKDLWFQGEGGNTMRCVKARNEQESFNASDWVKADDYKDFASSVAGDAEQNAKDYADSQISSYDLTIKYLKDAFNKGSVLDVNGVTLSALVGVKDKDEKVVAGLYGGGSDKLNAEGYADTTHGAMLLFAGIEGVDKPKTYKTAIFEDGFLQSTYFATAKEGKRVEIFGNELKVYGDDANNSVLSISYDSTGKPRLQYTNKSGNVAWYLSDSGISTSYTVEQADRTFVNVSGSAQSITTQHNFANGLKIGGISLRKVDNHLYIDSSLVLSGGVTMYGDDGVTVKPIWESIPLDESTLAWLDGKLSVIGGVGGGGISEEFLNVKLQGYQPLLSTTNKLPYSLISGTPDLSVYFLKSSFTKANIKTTLGIYDWALASAKPTYTASEVGALGVNGTAASSLKMTPEYLTDLNNATPWRFFDMKTGYGSTDGNKPNTAWVSGITGTVAGLGNYRWQIADTTGNARPYFRQESNGTWGNWQRLAFLTDLPTKLSQLTDDVVSGKYLSLSKFQVAEVENPSTVYLQSGIYRQSTSSYFAPGTSGWSQFITLFAGGDNWAQMYFSYDGRLHYRVATFGDGNPENIAWKAIITEKNIGNYNAGSATKLQTPRTIWGRSFDGTEGVYGTLYGVDYIRNINANIIICEDATDGDVYVGSNSFAKARVLINANGRLELTASGNVAIGGGTADAKLHVHGNGLFYNTLNDITWVSDTGQLIIGSTQTDYHLGFGVASNGLSAIQSAHRGVGAIPLLLNPKGGDVVIGGATVDEKLSVNGNVSITGGSNPYIIIKDDSDRRWYLQYYNNSISLGLGYNVGIVVDVNGNLLVTGAITMFSQLSMKNVIDYDGLSLAQLEQIKPARFTWKDNRDTLIHAGGIADDVMQVLPEVVHRTADDKLTMDYGSAGFFIATSLIKPVIDHEHRIADLERENQQLKQQLEQLSA